MEAWIFCEHHGRSALSRQPARNELLPGTGGSAIPAQCAGAYHTGSLIFQSCWKHERERKTQRNRCVVNVSSGSGLYVDPGSGQAAYGASKAAFNFLTLHLVSELAPYGVRANAICPAAFPEAVATGKVVEQMIGLAAGQETGEMPRR
jgi:NAD(P)-dependent dehydrogenase (short-subunit alcohol dehydrogenase family)